MKKIIISFLILFFFLGCGTTKKKVLKEKITKKPSTKVVYFDYNEYLIKKNSNSLVLSNYVKYIKENSNVFVNIVGHSDSFGSEKYNLELSRKRAEQVYYFFTKNGINKDQLNIKFLGESNLIVDQSKSIEEQAKNRRVEIKLN